MLAILSCSLTPPIQNETNSRLVFGKLLAQEHFLQKMSIQFKPSVQSFIVKGKSPIEIFTKVKTTFGRMTIRGAEDPQV